MITPTIPPAMAPSNMTFIPQRKLQLKQMLAIHPITNAPAPQQMAICTIKRNKTKNKISAIIPPIIHNAVVIFLSLQ